MSTVEIVKECQCGAQHSAADWARLRLVGHTLALRGQAFFALELRECTCGSCITRRLIRTERPAGRGHVDGDWGSMRPYLAYEGETQPEVDEWERHLEELDDVDEDEGQVEQDQAQAAA